VTSNHLCRPWLPRARVGHGWCVAHKADARCALRAMDLKVLDPIGSITTIVLRILRQLRLQLLVPPGEQHSQRPASRVKCYVRTYRTLHTACRYMYDLRPNNTFPVFATYLIPAASPPPLRGGAKSASNPFAGARKPGTWFSSLSGPAWAHADHADASSFWVCLAAPNAPMLPAAPPCALPPPSYLFSCAHRSPFSILFLSGLLAGCSPGVHPCSAT